MATLQPRGNPVTAPCANHGAEAAVKHHCSGQPEAGCCVKVGGTACHVAVYCRRCDHQWVEPCGEHAGAL